MGGETLAKVDRSRGCAQKSCVETEEASSCAGGAGDSMGFYGILYDPLATGLVIFSAIDYKANKLSIETHRQQF